MVLIFSIFPLLEKYGVPPKLVSVIRCLHKDFKLKFTLGKETRYIDYTVGVRQGDNMAPTLFLFLMQAMAESLEKKRQRENYQLKILEYRYHRAASNTGGRMRLQPNPQKTKGTVFKLLQALFVDDQFLLADSREELTEAAAELRLHMKRFGLLMHVGEKQADGSWTESKTEAMFFPALNSTEPQTIPAPAVFPDGQHRVEYTDQFKHLGSLITPPLTDEIEIKKRLRTAKNQMGALTTFFRTPADLRIKRQIYQAIPMNTALYGCESWTLSDKLERDLSSFHHGAMRKLLGLTMHHVRHLRIRNEHVRNKLSLPDLTETMHYRQFRFLGKIARLPEDNLQRRFLNAWIATPRLVGRPRNSLRHVHIETLQHILGPAVVSKQGHLTDWLPLASSVTEWNALGSRWLSDRQREAYHTHGDHPVLGAPLED